MLECETAGRSKRDRRAIQPKKSCHSAEDVRRATQPEMAQKMFLFVVGFQIFPKIPPKGARECTTTWLALAIATLF